MDRRVHDARSLRNSRVPLLSDIEMGGRRRPLSLVNASMPGAHSFGLLSNVVLARLERGGHLVLAVVGVKPGTAASVVAASVSDSLAGSGRRVVHIVADPSSSTPSLLGAAKGPGLADVLERTEPDAIEHLPGWGSPFQVITPGRASDKLGRWLGSDAMTRLVGRVRDQADLVLLEGPDLTTSADSYAVALSADATVIVVEAGRTTVDEVDRALDQFARLGVPVLGLVLVSGLPGAHAISPPVAPIAGSISTTAAPAGPMTPMPPLPSAMTTSTTPSIAGESNTALDAPDQQSITAAPVPPTSESVAVGAPTLDVADFSHSNGTSNGSGNGKLEAAALDVLPGVSGRTAHGTDRPS